MAQEYDTFDSIVNVIISALVGVGAAFVLVGVAGLQLGFTAILAVGILLTFIASKAISVINDAEQSLIETIKEVANVNE